MSEIVATQVFAVDDKTVRALSKLYPGEWNCFRAMISRFKQGACTVAPEMRSFKGFLRVLGPRPGAEWTVDRINNHDREYSPANVRWATKVEQANNRSTTIMLRYDGRVSPLTEWARSTGQNPATLRKRKARGWSDAEIICGRRGATEGQKTRGHTHKWHPKSREPERWENAYLAWLKLCPREMKVRRKEFWLWLAENHLAKLERSLASVYPDIFGESGPDPDVAYPTPEMLRDASFQRYELHRERVVAVRSSMGVGERSRVRALRLHSRTSTKPEHAIKWAREYYRDHQ